MTDWPELNRLAWLRLPCCEEGHPTRVEDYAGEDLVVSAPVAPHTTPVEPILGDSAFSVGWPVGQGAVEQPVKLVAVSEDRVPVWHLRRVGDPVETQRRNYVRMEYDTEAKLYFIEGGVPT